MAFHLFFARRISYRVDDIVFNQKLVEKGEHQLIDDWCRQYLDRMPTNFVDKSAFKLWFGKYKKS